MDKNGAKVKAWHDAGEISDIQYEQFEMLYLSGANISDVGLEEGILCVVLLNGQTVDYYPETTLPDVVVTDRRPDNPDNKPAKRFLGLTGKQWAAVGGGLTLSAALITLIIFIIKKIRK